MKRSFSLDTFCPEVYSQIEIDAEGDYKVCCLANFDKDFGMCLDKDGNVMNVATHTIEEAINSETHKQHRLQLANNERPMRCRSCYDSEDATRGLKEWGKSAKRGRSKRQRVLWETGASIPEYVKFEQAEEMTNEDGTTSAKVVNLDLRFGNLCNQKCIMCSPQHSNQWYDDWVAIGYGAPQYNRDKGVYKKGEAKTFEFYKDEHGRTRMSGTDRWWESDAWWEQFDRISPDLRYIYFTGGEPLIVPAMQECLDKLISKGYAKNIQLRYDTNLSVINKKIIDKWKHFKKVYFLVSVDDTDDRYNLIRHPGNFEKLKSNIIQLQKENQAIHYISTCVGIASPYSIIRISQLAKELGVDTYFRFLEGPNWLDIRNYPPGAKKEIIENLKKHSGDALYDKWAKGQIKLLEKYMDYSEEKHLKEFIRVMDILDTQRGTNWRKTLPDVADLFRRYCPTIYKE